MKLLAVVSHESFTLVPDWLSDIIQQLSEEMVTF